MMEEEKLVTPKEIAPSPQDGNDADSQTCSHKEDEEVDSQVGGCPQHTT